MNERETLVTMTAGDFERAKAEAYEQGRQEERVAIAERLKLQARHFENTADYRVAVEMQREALVIEDGNWKEQS